MRTLQRTAERVVAVLGDAVDALALDQAFEAFIRFATRVRGAVGRLFPHA